MTIKKIGRVWRTKKQATNVVMSGVLIDGARIGIIRAIDKDKKLIPETYDIIAFIEDSQQASKKEDIQVDIEKF